MTEEITSKIQDVKPGRGRKAVILPGGTPLADARATAKSAVIGARAARIDAKTGVASAGRQLKVADRDYREASRLDNKESIASAKQARIAAHKAVGTAEKLLTKAKAAEAKATEKRHAVEAKYKAAKAK